MRVVRYKSARLRAISVALLGFAILRYKSARLVFQKRAVTTAHLCMHAHPISSNPVHVVA
jgi:hypothetical protein